MNYQLKRWKRQDWRKGTRFYSCQIQQDIFGDWIVLKQWGRIGAPRGQHQEVPCERYEQGVKIFNSVAARRTKRGYVEW